MEMMKPLKTFKKNKLKRFSTFAKTKEQRKFETTGKIRSIRRSRKSILSCEIKAKDIPRSNIWFRYQELEESNG
ncbi:hypothetical protein RF55_8923 [Lasius niger]|uniref:Uncharacterized protein n=2 Tax=Lasius TaxID=488720 RepID=A0A0J7KLF2_LASNI|nr:hypothetical protein RF55_8923 [Lasius niger]